MTAQLEVAAGKVVRLPTEPVPVLEFSARAQPPKAWVRIGASR